MIVLDVSEKILIFGCQVMYNRLMDTILDKYPELHYNRLQYVFKPYVTIRFLRSAPVLNLVGATDGPR